MKMFLRNTELVLDGIAYICMLIKRLELAVLLKQLLLICNKNLNLQNLKFKRAEDLKVLVIKSYPRFPRFNKVLNFRSGP